MIGVGLGVTAQDQGPAIGGGKLYVEHLDGGKLIEHGTSSQPTCQRLKPRPQRDMQAIGDKGNKDVRFDAILKLMINRTQFEDRL